MSVPLQKLYDELHFLSDRMSTQVRAIAFSVLALVWLFLQGGSKAPTIPIKPSQTTLMDIYVIAVLALLFDFLQYLFGYLNTRAMVTNAEGKRLEETDYNYGDVRYLLRTSFFWLKQIAVVIAVLWLLYAIYRSLVMPVPSTNPGL